MTMPDTDEGVIHHVNPAPVPSQSDLPTGTHTFELSWSRRRQMMRLRDACGPDCEAEYEWWFKQSVGQAADLTTDAETGRMTFRGRGVIEHNGGHPILHMWRPKESNAK